MAFVSPMHSRTKWVSEWVLEQSYISQVDKLWKGRAQPWHFALQISAWEIPPKVVFFEIFLHWFRCMEYSLYDIKKYFQKPFTRCIWDSNWMPKGHWKYMGNITPQKVVFLTINIFAVYGKQTSSSNWLLWNRTAGARWHSGPCHPFIFHHTMDFES